MEKGTFPQLKFLQSISMREKKALLSLKKENPKLSVFLSSTASSDFLHAKNTPKKIPVFLHSTIVTVKLSPQEPTAVCMVRIALQLLILQS